MVWLALLMVALMTIGTSVWAGYRASAGSFWLNYRATPLWMLAVSCAATQVGAGAIIGLASATVQNGTGFALVSLVSTVGGFIFMGVIGPRLKAFGDSIQATTIGDFLGARLGRGAQYASGLVVAFTYIFLIAAQFEAFRDIFGIVARNPSWAFHIAAAFVIFYTSWLGMRGDIVSDVLEFGVKLIVLIGLGFYFLYSTYGSGIIGSGVAAGVLSPLKFGGWTFLVFGILFGACIPLLQPEIWFRVYASRDTKDARRIFIWAALLVLPFYLFAISLGFSASLSGSIVNSADQQVVQTLLNSMPRFGAMICFAGISAVILSCVNSLILAVSFAIHRDVLGRSTNNATSLRSVRLLTILAGVGGVIFADLSRNIVHLLLNCFYGLLVLGPSLLGAAFKNKTHPLAAPASIIGGYITTLVALTVIPGQAFLPGVIVSAVIFYGSSFMRNSRSKNLSSVK
jgi:solute:Na+ symporter, SSS family